MIKQKSDRWVPKSGIGVFHVMMASYVERSSAQKRDWPRNSIAVGKNQNIAINTGNWNNIGKHPDIGLTPAFWYNAIVACWRSCIFSGGYLALISSNCGFNTRILADDLLDANTNGRRINLITKVINKITKPMCNPHEVNKSNIGMTKILLIHDTSFQPNGTNSLRCNFSTLTTSLSYALSVL